MKLQELRLYNLLQYENDIVPVVGLNLRNDSESSLVKIQKQGSDIQTDCQKLKPVELTEEWLSNFGFKESYRSASRVRFEMPEFGGYDFDLSKDKFLQGFLYFGNYIKCQYIHQLQNLHFILTGKELKIKSN